VNHRSADVPRPDLAADRAASNASYGEIVCCLSEILRKTLTAYVAGVRDSVTIDRWASDVELPPAEASSRLRRTYVIALTLCSSDAPSVFQAWFTGLNPEFDDRSPIRLGAEGGEAEAKVVFGAARLFCAVG
jgi:hypothetical protein